MNLTYGSVCSGIEAASVAWRPLGWHCAFVSEIEAFPRAVLAHHYPDTPLHGDFTTIQAGEYEPIDLLVGGTPCQSFSVAGLRGGLDDDRGNLALEYLRLADRLRPRWLVWENVPGVLSSAGGRDFGAILGGMVELGYGVAYRVLDAQHFGVPQRRRRVFVVGYFGDWRRAAAVLFERHGLQGHPAPRREAGERTPARASYGISPDCFDRDGEGAGGTAGERSGLGIDAELAYSLRAKRPGGVATLDGDAVSKCLSASHSASGRLDPSGETFVVAPPLTSNPYGDHESREGLLVAQPFAFKVSHFTRDKDGAPSAVVPPLSADADKGDQDPLICFSSKDHGADAEHDLSPTLRAGGHDTSHANAGVPPAIAFNLRGREGGAMPETDDLASMRASSGGSSRSYIAYSAVRRLTPRECERLQGFPDDYTLIPWRKSMAADGPRYKALGNSMAVPVMAWIGQRIAAVDALAILQAEAA